MISKSAAIFFHKYSEKNEEFDKKKVQEEMKKKSSVQQIQLMALADQWCPIKNFSKSPSLPVDIDQN